MKVDLFLMSFLIYAIMMVIVGLLIACEIWEPFSDRFNSAMTLFIGAYVVIDYARKNKEGMKDNEIE